MSPTLARQPIPGDRVQRGLDELEEAVRPVRDELLAHPVFSAIRDVDQMRRFMEVHVFAVWDFMSLLKALQRQLTGTRVPWTPPANRAAARFVNEVVIAEESDEIAPGEYTSHFELYLDAMRECGADRSKIDTFVAAVAGDHDVQHSLTAAGVPPAVRGFVLSTMAFCHLRPHETAAAFLYGREDIIPEMFGRILASAPVVSQVKFRKLALYLTRHIEIDSDSHAPMARKLMLALCGDDDDAWEAARATARQALCARRALWDGVLADLQITA